MIPEIAIKLIDTLFKNKINEYCNKYMKDYGKLLSHKIDFNGNTTIYLTIDLFGEDKPMEVKLSGIKLIEENREHYIVINQFDVEKEWMHKLGQDFLDGKFGDPRIKVSSPNVPLLKKVIK